MSELCGTGLALTSMLRFDGIFGEPYGEGYIRKGIELLGVSKREEIEARWRKFEDAEKKLYAEIAEFYAEQAKLIYQVRKFNLNMEAKEVLDSLMGRRGAPPRCEIRGSRTRTLRVVSLKM
ncbi:uncharacterized protein LOC110267520 [Arachis ipaensis]|nr:uncharacterized protein LOC110267520 [Arachis ipaensis]